MLLNVRYQQFSCVSVAYQFDGDITLLVRLIKLACVFLSTAKCKLSATIDYRLLCNNETCNNSFAHLYDHGTELHLSCDSFELDVDGPRVIECNNSRWIPAHPLSCKSKQRYVGLVQSKVAATKLNTCINLSSSPAHQG